MDTFLTLFAAQVVLGGPGGAEVHAWVELVAQGMIDQHDNLWPT